MTSKKLKFIGLAGPAGAGKTTLAHRIDSMYSFNKLQGDSEAWWESYTNIDSFASVLKGCVHLLFPYIDWDAKEVKNKTLGKSPRDLYQEFGDLMRNAYGKDVFIVSARERAKEAFVDNPDQEAFIFDDVRFDDEAKMICEGEGGILIKLMNPSFRPLKGGNAQHATEKGVSYTHPDRVLELDVRNDDEVFNTLVKLLDLKYLQDNPEVRHEFWNKS